MSRSTPHIEVNIRSSETVFAWKHAITRSTQTRVRDRQHSVGNGKQVFSTVALERIEA